MGTGVASFPAELYLLVVGANALLCELGKVFAFPGLMESLRYLLVAMMAQVVIPAGDSEMLFQPQLCSFVVGATVVLCELGTVAASSQLMVHS